MVYNLAVHEYSGLKLNYSDHEKMRIEKTGKLFYEVGVVALNENEEWVGMFQERSPEMPK